jgi:hypothetical protein
MFIEYIIGVHHDGLKGHQGPQQKKKSCPQIVNKFVIFSIYEKKIKLTAHTMVQFS